MVPLVSLLWMHFLMCAAQDCNENCQNEESSLMQFHNHKPDDDIEKVTIFDSQLEDKELVEVVNPNPTPMPVAGKWKESFGRNSQKTVGVSTNSNQRAVATGVNQNLPKPLFSMKPNCDGMNSVQEVFTVSDLTGDQIKVPCGKNWKLTGTGAFTFASGMIIDGYLEIEDPGDGAELKFTFPFVVVTGHLKIGPNLKGTVRFKLRQKKLKKLKYVSYVRPATECGGNCDIDAGHTGFTVIGGKVELYGLPWTSTTTPVWSRLSATGTVGSNQLSVGGDLSSWPKGGEIVVATTEFINHPLTGDQTETFVLSQKPSYDSATDTSTLHLKGTLQHQHWGGGLNIANFGQVDEIAAEVALLTRRIVVEGPTDKDLGGTRKDPQNPKLATHGGHFAVLFTSTPQVIEGVEFRRLGQQGTFGRYPVHMHLCQSHPNTRIEKNAVVDCKQRCYVIHGTRDLSLQGNVAYNNIGHCFMMEDGYEPNVQIRDNFVSTLRPPRFALGADPLLETRFIAEDDMSPSGFWISHANTFLVGNAVSAACTCDGCDDTKHRCELCLPGRQRWKASAKELGTKYTQWQCSGVWFKMKAGVRGESYHLPGARSTGRDKMPVGSLAQYNNNVVHSSGTGFKYYEPGWRPINTIQEEGNIFYKNMRAYFLHKNQNFHLSRYVFVDNREAIHIDQSDSISLLDSAVVINSALTTSTSNSFCSSLTSNGDNTGLNPSDFYYPRGLSYDTHMYFKDALGAPHLIKNVLFSGFDSTCTDQDGNTVQPLAAVAKPERTSLITWHPKDTLEQIKLDPPTTVFFHAPPSTGTTALKIAGGADHPRLVPTADQHGRFFRFSHAQFWTWILKDSPDVDPATSAGKSVIWVRQQHWQVPVLGLKASAAAEPSGCWRQTTNGPLLVEPSASPWTGTSPTSVSQQLALCETACLAGGYQLMAIRRLNAGAADSAKCLCTTYDQVLDKDRETNAGKCDCANTFGGQRSQDYHCLYKLMPSQTANGQCVPAPSTTGGLLSCPATTTCFRTMLAFWDFGTETKTRASQLTVADMDHVCNGACKGKNNLEVSMFGLLYGGGQAAVIPGTTVGSGVVSMLGGREYSLSVQMANLPSNGDAWIAAPLQRLYLELWDTRAGQKNPPATFDTMNSCAINLVIQLPSPATSIPNGCSQAGSTVTCNGFNEGSILLPL